MFWQHSQTVSTFCRAKALYTSMRYFLIVMALVTTTSWAQMPIHSGIDHSARPRVPKAKLLRSNPHRFTAIRLQGTNPYDAPDDEFLCSSASRRPKVVPTDQPDDELSDYIQVRLAVARARALARYREMQS
jgi:hypothetical protein